MQIPTQAWSDCTAAQLHGFSAALWTQKCRFAVRLLAHRGLKGLHRPAQLLQGCLLLGARCSPICSKLCQEESLQYENAKDTQPPSEKTHKLEEPKSRADQHAVPAHCHQHPELSVNVTRVESEQSREDSQHLQHWLGLCVQPAGQSSPEACTVTRHRHLWPEADILGKHPPPPGFLNDFTSYCKYGIAEVLGCESEWIWLCHFLPWGLQGNSLWLTSIIYKKIIIPSIS
jgi:hypothetical protein